MGTTSPTLHADSVMITSAIEEHEARVVGTSDIKGAYLHANQDDFTVMRFMSEQVDVMCKINKVHKEYVATEKGRKTLYLISRALHGTVRAVLLWHRLLTSTLLDIGFKLNPHDLCIVNNIINNKQCTIYYHVDDTKVSHVERKIARDIFDSLENKFSKMKVVIGQKHEFLGMRLTFRNDGKFSTGMAQLLNEVINKFCETPTKAVTLIRSDLFEIDDDSPLVEDRRQKLCHRLVCKISYYALRERKDLQLATLFLTKRVEKFNEKKEA